MIKILKSLYYWVIPMMVLLFFFTTTTYHLYFEQEPKQATYDDFHLDDIATVIVFTGEETYIAQTGFIFNEDESGINEFVTTYSIELDTTKRIVVSYNDQLYEGRYINYYTDDQNREFVVIEVDIISESEQETV